MLSCVSRTRLFQASTASRLRLSPRHISSSRRVLADKLTPAHKMTEGEEIMFNKLVEKFSPTELAVNDVSGGCGSFYNIRIASPSFKGLSTIKQHKLVNDTLKEEIGTIHGLQLKTVAS